MSSFRLSGLNVALLLISVLALLFGVYGMVTGGPAEHGRPSGTIADANLDGAVEEDPDPLKASDTGRNPPKEKTGKGDPDKPRTNPSHNAAGALPDASAAPTEVEVESAPSDHGDAEIVGRVIGPAGAPVTGATVTARRSDLDLSPPEFDSGDIAAYREAVSEFLAKAARETRTTGTDADGKFAFKGLDPLLAYDLAASSEGHTGKLDRVAAGDSVVILMSVESALLGRVESKDGKPVPEFSLRVWPQNRQWEATSRSFTSADGRFSMPAKPGVMQVEVSASGFSQAKPQDVEVGKEAVIVLEQAAILSGIVTDKNDQPLSDVVVRTGSQEGNWNRGWNQDDGSASARTDSKGRYRFDTLPPKETKFTASLGEMTETQTITLQQGENKLDFKIDVGAIVILRLSGPDDKPVETDTVWFQEKGGRGWPRPERMPSREPGLVEFAGLKPGEYTVTVSAASYPAIRQDITVTTGNNELTMKFARGAMLTGVVTSSAGGKVSNIGVRLRKEDEERWGGWGTGRYAQVAEDGTYKLGPAEPGTWRIEVYATTNWSEIYSDTVTIVEGENSRNVVVDAGATVTIKLQDEQGNAIAWGNVQLTGAKSYNGNSNGEGVAEITFVEVGTYAVVATSRGLATPSQFISMAAGDNSLTLKLQKPNCCRITHVYPDTQAARNGLQVGDLIIEYNGQAVTSWGSFGQAVKAAGQAESVTLVIERGGAAMNLTLKGGQVGIEGTDGVR